MKTKYKKIAKALLDDYEMYREGYNRALKDVELLFQDRLGDKKIFQEIQKLAKRKHKLEKYA